VGDDGIIGGFDQGFFVVSSIDILPFAGGIGPIIGTDGDDIFNAADVATNGDNPFVSFQGGDGDDTFISGSNVREEFFGQGGNDTFIIEPGSGRVTITQFRFVSDDGAFQDIIDLSAFGITDFSQLNIIVTRGGTTLDLGNGDAISFNQFGGTLTADDFIFAESDDTPVDEAPVDPNGRTTC